MSTSAFPPPVAEAERLQTLRHYEVLSTPPDDVFQDLVALAAQLFSQPLAFLALVDEHEVVFPVVHGTSDMPPVPRAQALCSTAIQYPHAVAYENLAVAAQTGVDATAIRAALGRGGAFYAAAPLRMPDGYSIGVLCLMGAAPRPFLPAEKAILEELADVASLGFAVRHLCQATPELGPDQWRDVSGRLRRDVHALQDLARELLLPFGPVAPVPTALLALVQQALQALRLTLVE